MKSKSFTTYRVTLYFRHTSRHASLEKDIVLGTTMPRKAGLTTVPIVSWEKASVAREGSDEMPNFSHAVLRFEPMNVQCMA